MQETDVTAVGGTSFRADWTSGGDVSSYTLQVNRIEDGGNDPVLILSEGFSGINTNSDGYTDVGSSLDTYTDNPGWTGYKVYTAANHGLKFGTGDYAGYIVSPELELSSTVSIQFSAKNWLSKSGVSDNSSVIVSCGEISKTIELTDNQADYTVVLTGCSEKNIKLSGTGAKKRFYIYSVDIYNGDLNASKGPHRVIEEKGDSTTRTVNGITDTCYTVQALAEGTFEYMVKAIYLDGTQSPWSNIKHVTLTGIADKLIGDVNCDGIVDVEDVTTLIAHVLGAPVNTFDESAARINDDDVIDIEDVTLLINIVLGNR